MIATLPATDEAMTHLADRIEVHAERIRRLQATVRALARLPAESPTGSLHDTVLMSAAPTPLDTAWPMRKLPVADDTDLLAAAADVGGTAVVGLDAAGYVRIWNPAAIELFGWAADEVIDHPPPFVPTDKVIEHAGMIRAVQIRGVLRERATVRRRKDGSLVSVQVIVMPSRCGGVVFSYRGVEEQPSVPTDPAAGNLLALGRTAAGVVHDFNNLLAVIQAHAEVLCEELPYGHACRESATAIATTADLAAGVTRSLLDAVRPEQGTPPRADVNLHLSRLDRVIRSVVGAQVKVTMTVGAGIGAAAIHPAALTQVILNLVVNARDAMLAGGTLHVRSSIHDTTQVLITVADTGRGMDESTRMRIFDPFYTTRGDGTGLGLVIVRDAVTRVGGRVEVESAPDWGTQVRVYLPRA